MSVNVPYLGDLVEVSGVYKSAHGSIVQPGSKTMEGEIVEINQTWVFPIKVRVEGGRSAGSAIRTCFGCTRYLGRAS